MKLQIMSDIHVDHMRRYQWDELVSTMKSESVGVDALVMAGDFMSLSEPQHFSQAIGVLLDMYKNVIMVPGNHEYYGTNPSDADTTIDDIMTKHTRLVVLRNSSVTHCSGQRFWGGTAWFHDLPTNRHHRHNLNDFNLIKGLEPWLYHQAQEFRRLFRQHVDRDTIVVSHHLPSIRSCNAQYAAMGMDSTNAFFVNDMEDLIQEYRPKLWIHGHTHSPCDWCLGDTHVLCNPVGYPGELSRINNLVIDT